VSLKLPLAPGAYDKGDQAQMRGAVERADLQNRKRQEDLVLGPGQRLVFFDEHGAEQRYTGAILGGLVRSDTAAQGLSPIEQANARTNIDTGSGAGTPGGSGGQVQFNSGAGFGGFTLGGDASLNVLTGALTLAAVNSNAGVFGDATHVSQVAVNGKGLVTAASSVPIAFPVIAFNARTGAITLTSADVTAALGYAPPIPSGSSLLAGNGYGGFLTVTLGPGLNFSGGTLSATGALPAIGSGNLLGNAGAISATASDTTLTDLLDRAFGSTEGGLIVRGALAWQGLAASSTSGQALCSNGAGLTPSYRTVGAGGGGALVLLQAQTASASATLDFTSWQSASYDEYVIEFVNITPSTTGLTFNVRASTNGGSTWDSSTIYNSSQFAFSSAGSTTNGILNGNALQIYPLNGRSMSTTGTQGLSGQLKMYSTSGLYTQWIGHLLGPDNVNNASTQNNPQGLEIRGLYASSTLINGLRFFPSSGSFSGTIRIYGVSH
jgi:hypothetical protein